MNVGTDGIRCQSRGRKKYSRALRHGIRNESRADAWINSSRGRLPQNLWATRHDCPRRYARQSRNSQRCRPNTGKDLLAVLITYDIG